MTVVAVAARGAVVLALALVAACASLTPGGRDRKVFGNPEQDDWARERAERRSGAPLTERKLPSQPVSIEALVARFPTGAHCEEAAAKLVSDNPDGAWALVTECVRRKGFAKLDTLLEPPWIELVRARWPQSVELLAELVGRRGGNMGLDFGLMKLKRLQLATLAEAIEDPGGHRGRLVLLRAGVVDGRSAKRRFQVQLASDAGDVLGLVEGPPPPLRIEREYVFVARFERIQDPRPDNPFDPGMPVVTLLRWYPVGAAVLF